MVTRRVSEESLEAAKSSLTRRVTNRLLRYAAKVIVQMISLAATRYRPVLRALNRTLSRGG